MYMFGVVVWKRGGKHVVLVLYVEVEHGGIEGFKRIEVGFCLAERLLMVFCIGGMVGVDVVGEEGFSLSLSSLVP